MKHVHLLCHLKSAECCPTCSCHQRSFFSRNSMTWCSKEKSFMGFQQLVVSQEIRDSLQISHAYVPNADVREHWIMIGRSVPCIAKRPIAYNRRLYVWPSQNSKEFKEGITHLMQIWMRRNLLLLNPPFRNNAQVHNKLESRCWSVPETGCPHSVN